MWLLQDSLRGNGRTILIATVHEDVQYVEETHSTLQFANRASRIKVSVNPYRDVSQAMSLSDARRQINILRAKLQEYQQQQIDHRSLTIAPPLSSKASAPLLLTTHPLNTEPHDQGPGVQTTSLDADPLLPPSSDSSLSPDLEWRKQTGDPLVPVCCMYSASSGSVICTFYLPFYYPHLLPYPTPLIPSPPSLP